MKSIKLDQPHVLLMVGIQASGKTTFAREFAQSFNMPLVDIEAISEHAKSLKSANELTRATARELFKSQSTFMIDTDEQSPVHRAEYATMAKKHGYKLRLIWVQTDHVMTSLRLAKKLKVKDNDPRIQQIIDRFTGPRLIEKPIVISGRHTFATQARNVLKKLVETRPQTSLAPPPARPTQPKSGRVVVR